MATMAALAILAAYGFVGSWLHVVAKPAATLCALALTLGCSDASPRYRRGVLIGLALSTLADVLLVWPDTLFAAGLAVFLTAHLSYLVAFTDGVRLAQRLLPFIGYGLVAALLTTVLWPGIPTALHWPVLAYVGALAAMAAQAAARWQVAAASASARLGALGGAVFVLSDAVLALDRFRWPFAAAHALVLVIYWLAQAFIATSVQGSLAARR